MNLNARRDGLTFQISENQKLKGTLQNALLLALKSNNRETKNRKKPKTEGVKPIRINGSGDADLIKEILSKL